MIKTEIVRVRLNASNQIIPNSEEPIGNCVFPAYPQAMPNQPALITFKGTLYGIAATRWEVVGEAGEEEAILILAVIPVTISSLVPPQAGIKTQ